MRIKSGDKVEFRGNLFIVKKNVGGKDWLITRAGREYAADEKELVLIVPDLKGEGAVEVEAVIENDEPDPVAEAIAKAKAGLSKKS